VAKNNDANNGPTMQNKWVNTHVFYDSGYDDTIEPYDINTDINTILINAAGPRPPIFHVNDGTRFPSMATPSGDKSPLRITQSFSKEVLMTLSLD
jgi:hypothetical protein